MVMLDAGVLLRAMLDAYLQAEYIYCDSNRRQERSHDYLDFEHVERFNLQERVLKHDNWLSNQLKSSPNRPVGETRVRQEFDRVKARFVSGGQRARHAPARTRDKWYAGSLRDIANTLGKESEYDTFVAAFNGCVHSSALSVLNGPVIGHGHVVDFASIFAIRVARLNVLHNKLELGPINNDTLELFAKDHLAQT
jgi:hypothetical protein